MDDAARRLFPRVWISALGIGLAAMAAAARNTGYMGDYAAGFSQGVGAALVLVASLPALARVVDGLCATWIEARRRP